MLKKITTMIVGYCLCAAGFAQVNMTLQVPPSGVMQKNQLWNLVLVHTGDQPVDVVIELSLLDTRDNRPAMTASTRSITLTKGARQIQAADIAPLQYNYLSSIFNVDRNPNGMLPIGNFTACYVVTTTGGKSIMAEDCIPVEVAPLNPPLLNTPADGDAIEERYPQFTWLPPAPLNLFNYLSYDVLIVEVRKGQSSSEAIQRNMPVYNTGNIKDIFINYPTANKALDTGRLYAWRVIAKNNNQFVAQSEVWTFKITNKNIDNNVIAEGAYIKLKRSQDAAYAMANDVLRFEYINDPNDKTIQYSILSMDDANKPVMKEGILKIKYGQNLIDLPLKGLRNSGNYMLSLINSRNEKWFARFQYVEKSDSK